MKAVVGLNYTNYMYAPLQFIQYDGGTLTKFKTGLAENSKPPKTLFSGTGEGVKKLEIHRTLSIANTKVQIRLRLFTGRYAPFYSYICIKQIFS